MTVITVSALAFDTDALNLVTFGNRTKQTIEYIYLSPGDSEYWGPEILGSTRTLEHGDSLGFYILYPNECDKFDIMAIGEDGGTFIIYDHEICDTNEEYIDIYAKNLAEDAPDIKTVEIYIQNDTVPIHFVFISPGDSEMWGVDFLDENTILEVEDQFSLLVPAGDDPTRYDLLGVDEDGDSYQFNFNIDSDSDDTVYAIEVSDLQTD